MNRAAGAILQMTVARLLPHNESKTMSKIRLLDRGFNRGTTLPVRLHDGRAEKAGGHFGRESADIRPSHNDG